MIHSTNENLIPTPHCCAGKLLGAFCAVCGVLVMALPIPIVVDNFADYYSEQKKLEAEALKREAKVGELVMNNSKAMFAINISTAKFVVMSKSTAVFVMNIYTAVLV